MWDLQTLKRLNNMTPAELAEWTNKTYRLALSQPRVVGMQATVSKRKPRKRRKAA